MFVGLGNLFGLCCMLVCFCVFGLLGLLLVFVNDVGFRFFCV